MYPGIMDIAKLNFCRLVCVVMVSVTMSWAGNIPDGGHLSSSCGHTRYPSLCIESLRELGSRDEEIDVLSALVNKTMFETILPDSNFEKLSSHFISSEAQLTRIDSGYCRELMSMSRRRLKQAMEALKESPGKNKQDIQTWLSAALTFQETCKDSADAHADTNFWMAEISKKMEHLAQLSSNSLALADRIAREPEVKTTSGRRLSEETDFPRWLSLKDRKLLQANTKKVNANAIVAKDGSGQYTTISEAVRAASGGRFVIYVKSGVYNERVVINKDGITLIGDGKYSSVISGSKSVAGGTSLKNSATVTITGDNFIAQDIGIQNTAGPQGHQAVALLIASDRSVLYKCSIAGYQDTLYALSLRQFYRECDIHGTIDFIFGNAAAVFQSCNLVLRKPGRSGAYNVILAHGRTDPGQNTGFSVQNCRIGSDFSSVKGSYESYLGRPWRAYSRSVVMQSTIDNAIRPGGWIEWPGASSSFLKTLYFAEYNNVGPGASTSNRVQWPGFHVIGKDEAIKFTVGNFIAGNSWLPSTGVTFVSGLQ